MSPPGWRGGGRRRRKSLKSLLFGISPPKCWQAEDSIPQCLARCCLPQFKEWGGGGSSQGVTWLFSGQGDTAPRQDYSRTKKQELAVLCWKQGEGSPECCTANFHATSSIRLSLLPPPPPQPRFSICHCYLLRVSCQVISH